MKKTLKQIISSLLTVSMCASFAVIANASDEYDHIGFDYMQSAYSKGATEYIEVTAYDADNDETTFEGDLVFKSSNPDVVSVDENGLMTMKDYGVATVTAESGDLSASMMVTVKTKEGTKPEGTSIVKTTDMTRAGDYAYEITGGTLAKGEYDYAYVYAKLNQLFAAWNTIPANGLIEAWFYDNGETTNSEVGIYMSAYSNDTSGTKAIGVINAADTTYKLTGNSRRALSAVNNWRQGAAVGIYEGIANTDTGIKRTKGWHQVVFVRKNTNAGATKDDSGAKPMSNQHYIYLDGKLVDSETNKERTFVNLYGFAGFNSSTKTYIADAIIHQYIDVEDVKLLEENGGLKVNYTYYGLNETQNATYKWQSSDDGATWSDIAGEVAQSIASVDNYKGKYLRGGVKVSTASANSEYRYTDAYYVFDGTYESISLEKATTALDKGTTKTLKVTGYSHGQEYTVSDFSDFTFESSDEDVASINAQGVITAKDYGITVITVKNGDKKESVLVTVKKSEAALQEVATQTTEMKRLGSYGYEVNGGTLEKGTQDYAYKYANINKLVAATIPSNGVVEAWFYDSGEYENSEIAIYGSAYKNDTYGTKAIGVINSQDTTYKLTGTTRRSLSAVNNWREGGNVGVYDGIAITDTGIKREKGWHQVVFVRKNENVLNEATVEDGGARPKSKVLDIYLDGQLVDSEVKDRSILYIYAYAGYNSQTKAYVADVKAYQYVDVKNVKLTEENNTLKVNYTYYGLKETQAAAYKWQASADGKTWSDISGATSASYAPTNSDKGKFIRGAVKVTTASATGEYRYTESYYVFDGTYDSISLAKSTTALDKGVTKTLSLTGYSHGSEYAITDLSNVSFASSDENVVTVNANGVITAKDYGIAVVTAESGELSASAVITVKKTEAALQEVATKTTEMKRLGSYGYEVKGGTLEKGTQDYAYKYANINKLVAATIPSNGVVEAWFYDSGEYENSEIAIYGSAYKNDTSGTKAIGVINSQDTTYKLTGNSRRSLSAVNNWREGGSVGVYEGIAVTDTGIKRTKGWHQVVFVRKNVNVATEGSVEDGGSRPKSKALDIYLDGQLVESEVKDRSILYMYAYAGYDSETTSYVADVKAYQYSDVKDIAISANDGVLTLAHNYYGKTAGTKTIKWYSKGVEDSAWTEIPGATGATYTPDITVAGKYVRAGIAVADSDVTISERFSDAYYVEHDTNIEYANGNVLVSSSDDIKNAVIIIAEYETVGSFTKLVSAEVVENVNCNKNTTETVSVGTLQASNGRNIKVMLWDNVENQKALCEAFVIE